MFEELRAVPDLDAYVASKLAAFDTGYHILQHGWGSAEVDIFLALMDVIPLTPITEGVLKNRTAVETVVRDEFSTLINDCSLAIMTACDSLVGLVSKSRVAKALFIHYGVAPREYNDASLLLARVLPGEFPIGVLGSPMSEEEHISLRAMPLLAIYKRLPDHGPADTTASAGAPVGVAARHYS